MNDQAPGATSWQVSVISRDWGQVSEVDTLH